jgi:hypothetical protein
VEDCGNSHASEWVESLRKLTSSSIHAGLRHMVAQISSILKWRVAGTSVLGYNNQAGLKR